VLNYLYYTNNLSLWAPIQLLIVFSAELEDCRLTSKRVICSLSIFCPLAVASS